MKPVKRIVADQCCGVIVDLQSFFLAQIDKKLRARIKTNTGHFVRLLNYFRIPILATLERSLARKGGLPNEVAKRLNDGAAIFEKDFFDLTKEKAIGRHLAGLKRKQAIVAGCETDVCVLQSCLGLLHLGYDVFVVEELIFSSADNVDAAVARLRAEGVVFTSYKVFRVDRDRRRQCACQQDARDLRAISRRSARRAIGLRPMPRGGRATAPR